MAVTPVEYLIKANDEFTPIMSRVAESVVSSRQQVDAITKSSKASAEAFNTLGNALGGLPFGQQLSQFAALTERINQLNANLGTSRLQVLGMGAAMATATAVGAFQLGKGIGDLIFQTQKYNDQVDQGIRQSNELASRLANLAQQQRQERAQEIELIRDPEKKAQAQKEYLDSLNRELAGTQSQMRAAQKELERHTNQWTIWRGERAASMKMAANEVEQARQRARAIEEERDAIVRRNRIEAEQGPIIALNKKRDAHDQTVDAIKRQIIQLRIGNDEYQKQVELSNATTAAQREFVISLQKRREILQKAEADRQKAEQERLKSEQASDSYLQNLEAQLRLVRDGQEAADEYRAKLAGVSEQAIAEGRRLRQEIAKFSDAEKEATEGRSSTFQAGVQAKETRLLTGRAALQNDPVFKVQQNTFALLKEFREEKRTQRNQLEELRLIRRGRRLGQFVP